MVMGEVTSTPDRPVHESPFEPVTVQEIVSSVPHTTVAMPLGRTKPGDMVIAVLLISRFPLGSGGGTHAPAVHRYEHTSMIVSPHCRSRYVEVSLLQKNPSVAAHG